MAIMPPPEGPEAKQEQPFAAERRNGTDPTCHGRCHGRQEGTQGTRIEER